MYYFLSTYFGATIGGATGIIVSLLIKTDFSPGARTGLDFSPTLSIMGGILGELLAAILAARDKNPPFD